MKLQKEYGILIAIIIALLLYLFVRNPDRTHYRLPEIPEVSKADISKIEISKKDSSIVLKKREQSWHIASREYRADSNKVKNMLDTIEKLVLTALVSESKNYDRYDLTDDKKITVRAWSGDKLSREFEVGKPATSYRHTFVKLTGDDRVYHARENFRSRFDQTVDTLRDKTVLSFDKIDIQEIVISKGDQSMTFARAQIPAKVNTTKETQAESPPSTKTASVWQNDVGKNGDESKLNSLLSALSNLSCETYIDGKKKEDFIDPIYTVQLKGAQSYSLSLFAKKEKDTKSYPAISSESNYPFLLRESQGDSIMKKPDELLKKAEKS
jgi:hypothetical protein